MSLNYPLKSDNLKKWRNATEHYKLNEQGIQEAESHIKGGWFPVGLNNFWHGGIHLDGERPVHAVEDGQIVAYRITDNLIQKSDLRTYPEKVRTKTGEIEKVDKTIVNFPISNNFVLTKHSFTIPDNELFTFYVLYMHMLPAKEFQEWSSKADVVFHRYKVSVKKLSNPDGKGIYLYDDTGTQIIKTIPKHAIVTYIRDDQMSGNLKSKGFSRVRFTFRDESFEGFAKLDGAFNGPFDKSKQFSRIQITIAKDDNKDRILGLNLRKEAYGWAEVIDIVPSGAELIFENVGETTDENGNFITSEPRYKMIIGYFFNNERIDRKGYVFVDAKYLEARKYCNYKLDSVQTDPIRISKGDVLGWTSNDGVSDKKKTVHMELFIIDEDSYIYLKKYTNGRKQTIKSVQPENLLTLGSVLNENDISNSYNKKDFICDVTSLIKKINPKEGKKLDKFGMAKAVKSETLAPMLRTMVAKHRPEWISLSPGENKKFFERLKGKPWNYSKEKYDAYQELFFDKLAFWKQASDVANTKEAYFFHPIKFIHHLKQLEWNMEILYVPNCEWMEGKKFLALDPNQIKELETEANFLEDLVQRLNKANESTEKAADEKIRAYDEMIQAQELESDTRKKVEAFKKIDRELSMKRVPKNTWLKTEEFKKAEKEYNTAVSTSDLRRARQAFKAAEQKFEKEQNVLVKAKEKMAKALTGHVGGGGSSQLTEVYRLKGKKAVYIRPDKIKGGKGGWKKFGMKNDDTNKSFRNKNGTINRNKLVKKFKNVETKVKKEWKTDDFGGSIFGTENEYVKFFEGINDSLTWSYQDKDTKDEDINLDVTADAQLMRYYAGASAGFHFDPLKRQIGFEAKASAAIALAEGKLTSQAYWPNKNGFHLEFKLDVKRKNKEIEKHVKLGYVRASLKLEGTGFVGASALGSINIEIGPCGKTEEEQKKENKLGFRGSAKKRIKDSKGKNTASGKLFAGVEVGGTITGSLEWENPDKRKKKNGERCFAAFASVGYGVSGAIGLGGEAEFIIDYKDGKFLFRAQAGVVFGLGASGKIMGCVDAGTIWEFIQFVRCRLEKDNFSYQDFMTPKAFLLLSRMMVWVVLKSFNLKRLAMKRSLDLAKEVTNKVEDWLEDVKSRMDIAELLAERVIADPDILPFTTPEAKGILLYELSETSWLPLYWEEKQEKAILVILNKIKTFREFMKVCEHMTKDGKSISYEAGLKRLMGILDRLERRDFHEIPYIKGKTLRELGVFGKSLRLSHK